MKNPLSGEILIVVWCVLGGCVSGIWYDLFKALRKTGANSNVAVTFQDVLFWIGETAIIYGVFFVANNGVIRWYEIFFIIFGFALYRWLVSDIALFIWQQLFILIKVILRTALMPVRICEKFAKIHKKTKLARFLRRILKKQQ